MERLIYSKPIPCKIHRNSALLPRVTRSKWIPTPETFSSPSLTSFSLLPRRFRSLSLSHNEVCFLDSKGSSSAIKSGIEAETETHSLQRVAPKLSHKKRVVNAGLVRLLSPILLTFIVFAFAPPSFASLRNTTGGGGSAAVVAVGRHLIRSELLNSAWTGFFAGCLHTLSGPDHLAALAPLSIGRTRIESAAVGALWGCGHDAGQVLFGLLFLLLKDRLHIEFIRTWGSIVVGFTLIVIGAIGIKEASEASVQPLSVENGESVVGEYEAAALAIPSYEEKKKKIGFATFATGIVHGLQPDALMMILPALALPSRLAGAAFLLMFLVGTVFSMGSYTVFIGSCSQALKDRMPRITEKLTWVSSLVAIALGLAIIVSQFLGFSLY